MPPSERSTPAAARHLERALVFTFVMHVLAMLGMVVFLLPGVPGGLEPSAGGRAAYVAGHPWSWRIGWLGWQLTAASDLYLSIALVLTPWMPRRPAWFALIVTCIALLPDQIAQFIWSVNGPSLAASHLARGDVAGYAAREGLLFQSLGGWGAAGYLIAAFGWTRCLFRARTWNRWLAALSAITWSLFGVGVVLLCMPRTWWSAGSLGLGGALNAMAFVGLLGWIAVAGELVLRRSRPTQSFGRLAEWRYPHATLFGRFLNVLATSRFVRALFEYVPALAMRSDIRDVIYVNYLVKAATLAPHVPTPLRLQTLGPDGRLGMFTLLIYRHGHFGPRLFGPLRRQLWRSPLQSNWRLYVRDPQTNLSGVHFLTTAITAVPYALAARWLSEGVPMHVPADATLDRTPDGDIHAALVPGSGTAPDLRLSLRPTEPMTLPPPWQDVFSSWEEMLADVVPQNRALTVQPWHRRIVRQEIDLAIPLAICRPLVGSVSSDAARAIAGDTTPLCFYVPEVDFAFDGETYQAITDPNYQTA